MQDNKLIGKLRSEIKQVFFIILCEVKIEKEEFKKKISGVFKDWKIDGNYLTSPKDETGALYVIWTKKASYLEDSSLSYAKPFMRFFTKWESDLLFQEFKKECRRRAIESIETKDFTKHFNKNQGE